LLKEEEEFSDAIKACFFFAKAWWERQGRISLRDKDFNYVGWYINMKNRFGWKDKQDITSDDKAIQNIAVVPAKMSIEEWCKTYENMEE